MNPVKPKLSEQLRSTLRIKHYSYKTEKSYVNWVYRFIIFYKKKDPYEMGTTEVQTLLSYLAVNRYVSASTQNQALNALVFFYKHVIKKELGDINAIRARRPKRLPVVLTQEETKRLLPFLNDTKSLMVKLLYGSGLRLMECHSLRIKDIDFSAKQIIVRDGKGSKDRVTILPESITQDLKQHLIKVKALHEYFLKRGYGKVELPY